ncbi:MAG: pyruvate kinase [Bacteroidetes bacterium]|nr:MAG: pyruvate kinase [Bacteroidota bacterium]
MIKHNKTKIIATVGPASASEKILEKMVKEGVDIFRINFSHGSYEEIKKIILSIRSLNKKLKENIGILADLQGPKIRIGKVKNNSVKLVAGKTISFSSKECIGDESKLYINYKHFPTDVSPGEIILINDGKFLLEIISTNKKDLVKAKIIQGGLLSSNKGVNLPNTQISLPCLTEKDHQDLDFALENNVEWIGLSFVRSVTDVVDLKKRIKEKKKHARVIAKIEKPEALKEIDNIIDLADGIMVARGDLGVELPMEQVPMIQKMLVEKCINASRPVIIATQMMESMIENFSPTRAEVNDVANAVMDGADAVMLSAETSVGKYPVEVIQRIHKIVSRVEQEERIYFREHSPSLKTQTFISDSICYNACVMARQAHVSAIITMTNSGYTAFRISSHRPRANIFVFTDNNTLLTTLNLVWGVRGFYYDQYESTDKTMEDLKNYLKREGLLKPDDLVINTASMPLVEKGRTNMLRLSQVE